MQSSTPIDEPMTFNFKENDSFDRTVEKCEFLTEDQAREFVENGIVVVKRAFSADIAEQICDHAWAQLKEEHGIRASDRGTWRKLPNGFIRTSGRSLNIPLLDNAPIAQLAQTDVLGGRERLGSRFKQLSFHGGVIGNFGVENDPPWEPARPQQNGWHKDGWHFRHFFDSPEQGLLTVPIYTEILPQSGGTFLARDSIAAVARLLANNPQGFHADGTQGSGYLIPYLIEQCHDFIELTGEPGDLAIVHPYMLHRRTVNPTDRSRFIANLAIVIEKPMCFDRSDEETYSLVELAVLHALSKESVTFKITTDRRGYIPGPFRDESDRKIQRATLTQEMNDMAKRGVITPEWGIEQGYMSNNPSQLNQ